MRLNLLLCLFVPGINSADMVQPQCTLKLDTDFHGYDLGIGIHNVTSPDGCCSHCLQQPACRFFTWLNDGGSYANYCSLKTDGARNGSRRILGHVSGATIPVPPSPPPSPSPPTLPPPAMGVFFRVPWAGEVPQEQLDSWFALVARGRKEGPSSPYYVSELGLQQVATGQWPPINSSNPGIIYETELAKISKYFHLFDRVYVGTLLLPGKNYSNASYWTDYAEHQRRVATQFLELYPLDKYPNLGWYITEEGCLEDPTDLTALLHLSAPALHSVAPLPVLWSPGFCRKFVDLPGTPTGSILETELETMFCSPNMTVPVAVHFQDLCGQTSTFQFPFYYNYTNAMTSADGVAYYGMMKRVSAKCKMLREVKVNMEMFIEHRNPEGAGGEDHGAFILDGDPREIGDRKRVYESQAELGICWALPHWFNLNTYANATMDFQCTESQITNGTCTHPYRSVPVQSLSLKPRRS